MNWDSESDCDGIGIREEEEEVPRVIHILQTTYWHSSQDNTSFRIDELHGEISINFILPALLF